MPRLSKFQDVKAVLFDLYGTLGFDEHDVDGNEVFSSFLLKCGFEVYPQKVNAYWHYVYFVDYPARKFRTYEEMLRRILFRLDVQLDKKAFRELKETLKPWVIDNFRLYPDATPTVKALHGRGYKIGIITTTPKFHFEKAIRSIEKCFEAIVTGYEAMCEKSNPRIYLYAVKRLGVQPSQALMIGDKVKLDIENPQRLGIHGMLLNRFEKKVPQGIRTIRKLTDILQLL